MPNAVPTSTAPSKTLVIIAHPNLLGKNGSHVHRRWAEELAKHPDEFDVRNLYALYPNERLTAADVAIEQAELESHDLVVFQFPVYWYSAPALLRTWMDEVYAFGWAYGGERALPGEPGRKLAGKRFACAVSAGDIEANYGPGNSVGFTMEQVLTPFAATANYVGASCVMPPFAIYGAEVNLTDERLEASSTAYIDWLRNL